MLTSEELDYLRGIAVSDLLQTYTRITTTLGTADEYGAKARSTATTTAGLPCYYRPAGSRVMTETGPIILSKPTFYYRLTDGLPIGSQVTDVRDEKGIIIDAGPLRVVEGKPTGGLLWALGEATLERMKVGVRT